MNPLTQFCLGAFVVLVGLGIMGLTFYQVADAFVTSQTINKIQKQSIDNLFEGFDEMKKNWEPKPLPPLVFTKEDEEWAANLGKKGIAE